MRQDRKREFPKAAEMRHTHNDSQLCQAVEIELTEFT